MAAQHQKRVVQVEETGQVVDIYKWICIYPAHIDITKKATKVRKVNKTLGKHSKQEERKKERKKTLLTVLSSLQTLSNDQLSRNRTS